MIAVVSVVLSGLLSGVVALAVALITQRGSIQRDHEADWRKLKLDLYKEFVSSAAGIVPTLATREARIRYLNAANVLLLVGSKDVVKALNLLQDNHLDNRYLKPLFLALRSDINPLRADEDDLNFKFVEFSDLNGDKLS
jgi:hypothetical protein